MILYYIVNTSNQYLYSIDDNTLTFGYSALKAFIFIKKENVIKFKKEIELNYKNEVRILKQENKKTEILNF